MDDYRIVQGWLLSLFERNKKKVFTPEVDATMQRLWEKREGVTGKRRIIIRAISAVREYRVADSPFTPYYIEKLNRLDTLWQKVPEQAQALKDHVEKNKKNKLPVR